MARDHEQGEEEEEGEDTRLANVELERTDYYNHAFASRLKRS